MSNRIIHRFKQVIPSAFSVQRNKTSSPLLNSEEILDLLHRIQNKKKSIQHKHDIAHRQQGDVRSLFRGYGMDYEESRRYQAGDDPRYMNWQLSARTGQHYMKVFREERQPDVFILMDRRSPMRFGTQTRLKITQAARAATIAALSAQQNNLSVGGVILSNELRWFKADRNKQAIFDFIQQMARPASPAFTTSSKEEQSLADALKLLNEILIPGSIIYLVSDFHDLDETHHALLLRLTSLHQVHAIQISDPAEVSLPKAGLVKLIANIAANIVAIDSNRKMERDNFQSAADNYYSVKKNLFKNLAISYQEFLTSSSNIEEKIIF